MEKLFTMDKTKDIILLILLLVSVGWSIWSNIELRRVSKQVQEIPRIPSTLSKDLDNIFLSINNFNSKQDSIKLITESLRRNIKKLQITDEQIKQDINSIPNIISVPQLVNEMSKYRDSLIRN